MLLTLSKFLKKQAFHTTCQFKWQLVNGNSLISQWQLVVGNSSKCWSCLGKIIRFFLLYFPLENKDCLASPSHMHDGEKVADIKRQYPRFLA